MSRWMQMVAVDLAAMVSLVPAFAQVSYAQAVSPSSVVLPVGEELSDEDLLEVDGEADPLTWVAAAICSAGIEAGVDLFDQGIRIARGEQSGVDWSRVGSTAAVSLVTTPLNLTSPATVVIRSTIVTGARWTAQAVAVVGAATVAAAERAVRAAVSVGQRTHEALHTVHVALHTHVREPVVNAVGTAWDWLTGR